jgi:Cof subfamily protein (haloacid dehalogenase superfamily)
MSVKLIALDIDGTLLNGNQEIPEANRAAIAEASSRGVEIALVTGRRYDFAMLVADKLGSPLTMIASNGAVIRSTDGQTQVRQLLPADTAKKVLQNTRQWKDGTAVIFDRPGRQQILLEAFDPEDTRRYWYYTRNKEYISLIPSLETCLTGNPLQILFSGEVKPMREVEGVLRQLPFANEYAIAATVYEDKNFTMIDVVHPDVSKGTALTRWASQRGIEKGEIMAIGDNHNDMEMLSLVGTPVVMANGVPELKTFGWHQTLSNDEAGVAAAIEHFVLGKTPSCA